MAKYTGFRQGVDENQPGIVKALRKIQGVMVELDHDDILVGYKGRTFWYEIKPERELGKNGQIRESRIKPHQKELRDTWPGHYRIVWKLEQILEDLGIGI